MTHNALAGTLRSSNPCPTIASLCLAASLAACDSGGGGGGDGGPPVATGAGIDFLSDQVVETRTQNIDAEAGGVIEAAGGKLEIPPGALADDAQLTLIALSSRAQELGESDGALGGERPISDVGFIVGADREVGFSEPLLLEIPINPALLPPGVDPDDISIAIERGGYLIPQGATVDVDLEAGVVRVTLPVAQLLAGLESSISPLPPMAVGLPFLLLFTVNTTGLVAMTLNPVVAIIKNFGYETEPSRFSNFNIKYREGVVSLEEVEAIGDMLEDAYDLFVDDMGFSLPNFFNFDGRYTVVVDDLETHTLIRRDANGNVPDGFTINGSGLFEGISFVHSKLNANKRLTTAVHEYFHALQAGALSSPFISTLADSSLNPQSAWLFEGSATALSGRVVLGNGSTPARDVTLASRLRPGFSLYNPAQDPAADVAQDFFFFLERGFGSTDFYLPMFEALGPDPLDNRERAVRAVDTTLRQFSGDTDDLSKAWDDFVVDSTLDNPGLYPGVNPSELLNHDNGLVLSTALDFEPLSYHVLRISVPPLATDGDGNPLPDQETDLLITETLSSPQDLPGALGVTLADVLGPSAGLREVFNAFPGDPRSRLFEDFRTTARRNLFLVGSNSLQSVNGSLVLNVMSELKKPETGEFDFGSITRAGFTARMTANGTFFPDMEPSEPQSRAFQLADARALPLGQTDCPGFSGQQGFAYLFEGEQEGGEEITLLVGGLMDATDCMTIDQASVTFQREVAATGDCIDCLELMAVNLVATEVTSNAIRYRLSGSSACSALQDFSYEQEVEGDFSADSASCDGSSVLEIEFRTD